MNEHARDMFITGLLQELPPAGGKMPYTRRRKWLDAARAILDLLYDETEGSSPTPSQSSMPYDLADLDEISNKPGASSTPNQGEQAGTGSKKNVWERQS